MGKSLPLKLQPSGSLQKRIGDLEAYIQELHSEINRLNKKPEDISLQERIVTLERDIYKDFVKSNRIITKKKIQALLDNISEELSKLQ